VALAPLRPGERLRLALRLAWSIAALLGIFAIFLPLRGFDLLLERLAGRPVTRSGNAIVRLWLEVRPESLSESGLVAGLGFGATEASPEGAGAGSVRRAKRPPG